MMVLGGLPTGDTTRIFSNADSGYRTSLVNGLMPALKRRCLADSYDIPSISEISVMVKKMPLSFIKQIIIYVTQSYNILNNRIVKAGKNLKKMLFYVTFLLTLLLHYVTMEV
jgi:hypothetical protein